MPEIPNLSEKEVYPDISESYPESESSGIQPEYESLSPSIELSPPTEYTKYEQGQQHIQQVVETQKVSYQNTKQLPPKIVRDHSWLLEIEPSQRVAISMKLITTKAKDILEVIHSFLEIEDYVGLDSLEESLNSQYSLLIEEQLLPDINTK
jgi:hypothetical protein